MEIRIDVSKIKKSANELCTFFSNFLASKNAGVTKEKNLIVIIIQNGMVPKKYLRLLLRKFLHKKILKNKFRVISYGENMFKIVEKKIS